METEGRADEMNSETDGKGDFVRKIRASRQNGSGRLPSDVDLTACIPLRVDGKVPGAIAIFKISEQECGLGELDIE